MDYRFKIEHFMNLFQFFQTHMFRVMAMDEHAARLRCEYRAKLRHRERKHPCRQHVLARRSRIVAFRRVYLTSFSATRPPASLDPEMVADGQEEEEEQHGGDDVLGNAEDDHAVGNVEVNARGKLSGRYDAIKARSRIIKNSSPWP